MSEPIDSPQSAVHEITSINVEIATFFHEWATAAGNVKVLSEQIETMEALVRRHLRATRPEMWKKARAGEEELTVADRDAEIRFQVDETDEGIYTRLAKAEATVEECRTKFKALDRRAGNAQSILAGMRDEMGIKDFVYYDTAPDV